jgi:hypothetical protein
MGRGVRTPGALSMAGAVIVAVTLTGAAVLAVTGAGCTEPARFVPGVLPTSNQTSDFHVGPPPASSAPVRQ